MKESSFAEVVEQIEPGMTVMIGGFLAVGTPEKLITGMINKGIDNLTVIANETSYPDRGIGRLVVEKLVDKVIVSHIGTNPVSGKQMNNGELEVDLIPQGTLVERIRAGGAGLGGVLTPVGVGTKIAEGKEILQIKGEDYLLELPLRADVALLKAWKADRKGNLIYRKAARNFNPIMATAADKVLVEAEEIVEVGKIDPARVHTPGVYVDMVFAGGGDGE